MNEHNPTTVVTGRQIDRLRLKTIEVGLRLECRGLRHSHNSVAAAAKQILRNAGITPARTRAKLYEQFRDYVASNS